ncbi:uracil-DNA glycosylase family protein [Alteromonas sediminis]
MLDISRCTLCSAELPFDPRPILALHSQSRLLIVGQAPGLKAHETNKPWNDASGARLRSWLCIDEDTFYYPRHVALLPMGFCFPGYKNNADAPPMKVCAQTWHNKVLSRINPLCTVIVGRFAQRYYANESSTLTQAIKEQPLRHRNTWVMPHPSGRNNRWLAKNSWFTSEVLPDIQRAVAQSLLVVGEEANECVKRHRLSK